MSARMNSNVVLTSSAASLKRLPAGVWLAVFMLSSSKKGISTHQLHRSLGVTYKTAWFMIHRIREAMRSGELAPMGGGTVEADETYFGSRRAREAPHQNHARQAL